MQKMRNGRAVVQSGAAIRQYALNDNHEPLGIGKLKGKHKPGTGKQVPVAYSCCTVNTVQPV